MTNIVYSIYQLGDETPKGFELAFNMLNRMQTIWNLIKQKEIEKPSSFDPTENITAVLNNDMDASLQIGITKGRLDLARKLSFIDKSNKKALISEFEWRQLKTYDPPEVFWAFSLANIFFQTSINSCSTKNCLGYNNYRIDKLLLNLLVLDICDECKEKILFKYKYQIPEITRLVDILKKPSEYKIKPAFKKPDLPVFERQVKRQKKLQIFKNFGIVVIMHFLENLVSFVEGLVKLGADQGSIALAVKPYPYRNRQLVYSYLLNKYPEIHIEFINVLPPTDNFLKNLVEYCQSKSQSGKILVIEDGGYLVPFLHRYYSTKNNFCIGAVEQTTKGLRKDEKLKKLQFPILNVAKSKFKDEYESPLVGRSIAYSIQKLLPDTSFSGKTALVIGFGAVGRQVANSLADLGMIVKVYDAKQERIAAARVRGFETAESPVSLVKDAKLIVGTAGNPENWGINKDILERIGNETILVSASSDKIEIDIDHLETISSSEEYMVGIGTYYKRKKEFGEDTYLLLADGFPINFYYGSGIPTTAIDPVLAQLFIGAVHIVKKYNELKPRIHHIMDDLIKEYSLLEDFIHTHI